MIFLHYSNTLEDKNQASHTFTKLDTVQTAKDREPGNMVKLTSFQLFYQVTMLLNLDIVLDSEK